MQFRRQRMVVLGAAFLVAVVMLLMWPPDEPVYITSPFPSPVPGEASASDDRGAAARQAVYIPSEALPLIPSSQPERRWTLAEPDRNSTLPAANRVAPQHEHAFVGTAGRGNDSKIGVPDRTRASVVESIEACTYGVAALGLCPSEPEQSRAAPDTGSSPESVRPPPKDQASVRCNEAAVALGLCAQ
jgi:hypothetical protein